MGDKRKNPKRPYSAKVPEKVKRRFLGSRAYKEKEIVKNEQAKRNSV